MSRTKTIYFLSAFVLIIGCFALNKSYSLFTQNIESEPISATVPKLDVSLSISNITVEAGKEYLIKQTVTNNSVVPVNFAITVDHSENVSIANTGNEENLSYGESSSNTEISANASKNVYLVVSNKNGTESIDINFLINYNYSTINSNYEDLTNIDNIIKKDVSSIGIPYSSKVNTLSYKIMEYYANANNLNNENLGVTTEIESLFDESTNILSIPVFAKTTGDIVIPESESTCGLESVYMDNWNLCLYNETDGTDNEEYKYVYYFKGNGDDINNYIKFNGSEDLYRIVRTVENNGVKIVKDGTINPVSPCKETGGTGSNEIRYVSTSLYSTDCTNLTYYCSYSQGDFSSGSYGDYWNSYVYNFDGYSVTGYSTLSRYSSEKTYSSIVGTTQSWSDNTLLYDSTNTGYTFYSPKYQYLYLSLNDNYSSVESYIKDYIDTTYNWCDSGIENGFKCSTIKSVISNFGMLNYNEYIASSYLPDSEINAYGNDIKLFNYQIDRSWDSGYGGYEFTMDLNNGKGVVTSFPTGSNCGIRDDVSHSALVRPAFVIKGNSKVISGTGTSTDPYIIDGTL